MRGYKILSGYAEISVHNLLKTGLSAGIKKFFETVLALTILVVNVDKRMNLNIDRLFEH